MVTRLIHGQAAPFGDLPRKGQPACQIVVSGGYASAQAAPLQENNGHGCDAECQAGVPDCAETVVRSDSVGLTARLSPSYPPCGMKGFPNQIADLGKLAQGMRCILRLLDEGENPKDDGVLGE